MPETPFSWPDALAGTDSPLPRQQIPPQTTTECGEVEIDSMLGLLRAMRPRPVSVVIGSAADAVSRLNATRLGAAWAARGGLVLDTVAWPETAASWLRHARRFTAPEPDAWLVTAAPAGWIGMGRRLVHSTNWSPQRTVAGAALADPVLIAAGGVGTFDLLRGAHADGRTWEIAGTQLLATHDERVSPSESSGCSAVF